MKPSTPKPAKLKRYYLKPGKGKLKGWILQCDVDINPLGQVIFPRKWDAINQSAAFIRSHGGGTLRIMLRNGKFQEERTYPKSADPRRSKG